MKNCKDIFAKFKDVDAVILSAEANTYYVSEYRSTFCHVLLTRSGGYFLTDTRYIEEAQALLAGGFEFVAVTARDVYAKMSEILDKVDAERVGFENLSISYENYVALENQLHGKQLIPVEKQLLAIRAVKQSSELSLIKKAAHINDLSFADLLGKVKEGVTERELAYELEYNFRRYGADGIAFETIVAFGENTSKPHAHPADRKLIKGTPVTIDFGCKYKGYCSDITRTFMFGMPSDSIIQIYNAVLDSNKRGIESVAAGVKCADVDAVCRNYLKTLDLDKFFVHGTGHGVGVDIHEAPILNPLSTETLAENMVVTVEPGVYIPGVGGARVEDLMVVTKNGCELLSHTPKELLIL